MRISWITRGSAPPTVDYGKSPGTSQNSATGSTTTYKYALYKSGQIHEAVIGPLEPNTVYYYRCSSDSAREFSFKTPPTQFPIKFAVAGMWKHVIINKDFHLKVVQIMGDQFLVQSSFKMEPGELDWENRFLKIGTRDQTD